MLFNWILVSLTALTAATAPSNTDGWHADYGQALEQVRQSDKPLLVVLDIPSDPAQSVDSSLLSIENGLANYDLCHVDVSTEYGKKVAEVFHANTFPHVAIIDKSGTVILSRLTGSITESNWKSTLSRFESGLRQSGTVNYSVSKPVVSSSYTMPNETYQPKPYCPSCQLNKQSYSQPSVATDSAVSHTVSKPAVSQPAPAAYTMPADTYQAKPYCPSCQLRNQ